MWARRTSRSIFPAFVIPSTIHFVWSGKDFPSVFALAVRSAAAANPGWKVVIHAGLEPEGNEAWERLRSVAEIRRQDPEELLAAVPEFGSRLVELHRAIAPRYHAGRSNLVRLAALVREGGWYLDFDTLAIGSFEALSRTESAVVGEEWVWKDDEARVARGFSLSMIPSSVAFGLSWAAARIAVSDSGVVERTLRRVWGRRELNNAVLACEPGHPWFVRLLELACSQDPSVRFALGPSLVNRGWREPGAATLPRRMGPEAFYQFPPSQTCRYFRGGALPPGALVLHWCSSNHKDLLPRLDARWAARHAASSPWAAHAFPYLESSR